MVSGDLLPTADARIDETCGHFMSEWQSGHRPRIEDALEIGPTSDTIALLRNLLVLELSRRRLEGEAPTPGEYQARFPAACSAHRLSLPRADTERRG